MIVCPACRVNNEDSQTHCHKCGTDLVPLIRIREQYKVYYNHGLHLAQQRDFPEAIRFLLLAALLNPRQEQAYIILGKIFAQRNDYETARHYFTLARNIAPKNRDIAIYLHKVERLFAEQTPYRQLQDQFIFTVRYYWTQTLKRLLNSQKIEAGLNKLESFLHNIDHLVAEKKQHTEDQLKLRLYSLITRLVGAILRKIDLLQDYKSKSFEEILLPLYLKPPVSRGDNTSSSQNHD